MKDIDSLIRLYRWNLDEKRRNLGDLERLRDDLLGQVARLEREVAAEQATASAAEMGFAYPAYARAAIERRAILARSIAEVDGEIATVREIVAEAFQEVKKYELLQEQRQRREALDLARREQMTQDELALQGFRRRQLRD